MKIGMNTYEQRPHFKASFAKTAETKKALKELCKEGHYRFYEMQTALKKAKVKDVIEVTLEEDSPRYARIFNDFIFKNTANNHSVRLSDRSSSDGFSNLILSNQKKIADYEFTGTSPAGKERYYRYLDKVLSNEANTTKDRKVADKMLKLAENLEARAKKLRGEAENMYDTACKKETEYLLREINLM